MSDAQALLAGTEKGGNTDQAGQDTGRPRQDGTGAGIRIEDSGTGAGRQVEDDETGAKILG